MQRKNKMLYLQHIENNLEKNMKIHICIINIVCLFLSMSPLASYAGRTITVVKQSSSNSNDPDRSFSSNYISIGVKQTTCELVVTVNHYVDDLHLMLTQNGITYEEDEGDVLMGQVFSYRLGGYDEGVYVFTVASRGIVYDIYSVIIEDVP